MAAHLIFACQGTRYAIPATAVRTTFWLPELSPVEDLPPWCVGLIDLHAEVIPVLDLGRRLGHPDRPYRLDQAVILLEQGGLRAGLIADALLDLVEVGPDAVAPYVRLAGEGAVDAPAVIAGTLKWTDGVLILIDPQALLSALPPGAAASPPPPPPERGTGQSAAERARLRERTHRLALPPAPPDTAGQFYALVQIGTGCYAIALEQVAEFTRLGTCTPLPCCPPHILGCMNLRGAILTVLDLAPLLQGAAPGDYGHLVVLRPAEGQLGGQLGERRLGLAVHAVLDLCPGGAAALTSTAGPAYGHPHCKWVLHYDGGAAGVLDPEALLAAGILDVDEQV